MVKNHKKECICGIRSSISTIEMLINTYGREKANSISCINEPKRGKPGLGIAQEKTANIESRHWDEGWFAKWLLWVSHLQSIPFWLLLSLTRNNYPMFGTWTKQSRPANAEVTGHSVKYKSMVLFTELRAA